MKRIQTAVLINHSGELGGAEFALKRLVAGLDRRSWHPVVVFSQDGPAVNLLKEMSVETYVIPMNAAVIETRKDTLNQSGLLSIKRLSGGVQYAFRIARFLRERAADVVHTNSMKAHVLGGAAAKMAGIPLVWHVRDSVDRAYLPGAAVRMMRVLAKRLPNAIITVSEAVAKSLLGDASISRAKVIYDGLSSQAFENPATPRNAQEWKVGIVGRLSPWKGQHVFLEAAASLSAKGYSINFEILGSPLFGEEKYAEGLKRQVTELGLSGRVTFSGFVNDVPRRIREWDILVHASTSPDPCPNVVLEAMAAGVPVIGTNGGGVPELLQQGACGELFTMGDNRELAALVEKLMLNLGRRTELSIRARERAKVVFRSERVAQEVQSVWGSLVSSSTWKQRRWPWVEDGVGGRSGAEMRLRMQVPGTD